MSVTHMLARSVNDVGMGGHWTNFLRSIIFQVFFNIIETLVGYRNKSVYVSIDEINYSSIVIEYHIHN